MERGQDLRSIHQGRIVIESVSICGSARMSPVFQGKRDAHETISGQRDTYHSLERSGC